MGYREISCKRDVKSPSKYCNPCKVRRVERLTLQGLQCQKASNICHNYTLFVILTLQRTSGHRIRNWRLTVRSLSQLLQPTRLIIQAITRHLYLSHTLLGRYILGALYVDQATSEKFTPPQNLNCTRQCAEPTAQQTAQRTLKISPLFLKNPCMHNLHGFACDLPTQNSSSAPQQVGLKAIPAPAEQAWWGIQITIIKNKF